MPNSLEPDRAISGTESSLYSITFDLFCGVAEVNLEGKKKNKLSTR